MKTIARRWWWDGDDWE